MDLGDASDNVPLPTRDLRAILVLEAIFGELKMLREIMQANLAR